MDIVRTQVLCKSQAGNPVPMLNITDFKDKSEDIAKREGIILSGRVHPGENNASWVMEGIIDFLLSNDKKAKFLRKNFVIKIVPILNADGVIVGNTRGSLGGLDYNRQWTEGEAASKANSPEIYAMRHMIAKT